MKNVRKQLKDLTIRDNFLFAAVMMQEDNCKRFLEILLGIEIDRIEISYEKSIVYNPEFKGVRLDVYARDEDNTRYDIEMQVAVEHLGKRIRYYHSQMDMDLLVSGHDYEELPKTYVIFICDFDPFGLGRYCYTFRSQCLEEPGAELGDGAQSIILSTRGKHPERISSELEAFLSFVRTDGKVTHQGEEDPFVKRLQETIHRIKNSREMERRYMYLEDLLRHERKQAMAEGEARGILETRRNDILELLEELGEIPDSLRERILSEKDADRLKHMLKMTSKVQSIEAFEKLLADL